MKRALREAIAVRIRKIQRDILEEGYTVSYDEVAARMKMGVGAISRLCRKYGVTGDQAHVTLPDARPRLRSPAPSMTPEQSAKFRAMLDEQIAINKGEKNES